MIQKQAIKGEISSSLSNTIPQLNLIEQSSSKTNIQEFDTPLYFNQSGLKLQNQNQSQNHQLSTQDSKNIVPSIQQIQTTYKNIKDLIKETPVTKSEYLSKKYEANIYIKREDHQYVRSFKLRGAINKIQKLTSEQQKLGLVCASAGNHSQGFAYSCSKFQIKGTVFMPVITPKVKLDNVKKFGGEYVDIQLVGEYFDQAYQAALIHQKETGKIFIHPFDDYDIIEGQGSVGVEILNQFKDKNIDINMMIIPIGGGGLFAGVAAYISQMRPDIKIIGCEPLGSPSMKESLIQQTPIKLSTINAFVDGASVMQTGQLTFSIINELINEEDLILIPEGLISKTILDLYKNEEILAEPAGSMSIATLELIKDQIKGQTIVCVLSGSNTSQERFSDFQLYANIYQKKTICLVINKECQQKIQEFLNIIENFAQIIKFDVDKLTQKTTIGIELDDLQFSSKVETNLQAFKFDYQIISIDLEAFKLLK